LLQVMAGGIAYQLQFDSAIFLRPPNDLIKSLKIRWNMKLGRAAGRAEAARPTVREVEPVVAETQEAQFVSLEDADAEARGEKKPCGEPEAEDEVEPDDESLDDDAQIPGEARSGHSASPARRNIPAQSVARERRAPSFWFAGWLAVTAPLARREQLARVADLAFCSTTASASTASMAISRDRSAAAISDR
jgi:hypothetical protein